MESVGRCDVNDTKELGKMNSRYSFFVWTDMSVKQKVFGDVNETKKFGKMNFLYG